MRGDTGAANVCLTGGEPILQNRRDMDRLVHALDANSFFVEMFSNGTLPYSPCMIEHCHIVMDWKLPGSGESYDDPTRCENLRQMRPWLWHTIKFTCADMADLEMARAIHNQFDLASFGGSVYVGPVWDTKLAPETIVEFVLKHRLPWRLNLQVHKYIWDPMARRT
jgi:7-carboxy-7-deazaguanine synthase